MKKLSFLLLLGLLLFPINSYSQKRVKASYYAHRFHGRVMANGEKFDMYKLTCAHKKYPFGTILKVRNPKNDKVVYVTVKDRGPYIRGRSIDLSYQAAKEINMIPYGVLTVEYEVVDEIPPKEPRRIFIRGLDNLTQLKLNHKKQSNLNPKSMNIILKGLKLSDLLLS